MPLAGAIEICPIHRLKLDISPSLRWTRGRPRRRKACIRPVTSVRLRMRNHINGPCLLSVQSTDRTNPRVDRCASIISPKTGRCRASAWGRRSGRSSSPPLCWYRQAPGWRCWLNSQSSLPFAAIGATTSSPFCGSQASRLKVSWAAMYSSKFITPA
jgi:hypothetical protein